MRILRRLLARSLLAPLLLLPLLSCGYAKPSTEAVMAALKGSDFNEPKSVVVPRHLEAHTDESFGGGKLDDRQLAKIDPVLAIMHANKLVEIQDLYAADGGEGGYDHILTIIPSADAPTDLFAETDEPGDTPFSYASVRKTPGWRVTLGRREVVKLWQIETPDSPNAERLSAGYVLARFDFHWIPTEIGKVFDVASLSFDDLPEDLQGAMVNAAHLDSRRNYGGMAWMTRDKNGKWRVTLFDCRQC